MAAPDRLGSCHRKLAPVEVDGGYSLSSGLPM
jgi:hypothetical protein